LHLRIVNYITENYQHILSGDLEAELHRVELEESGLLDFGFRNWLFEVAESGLRGNIENVEQMPLYDFLETLDYIRSKNKYIKLINESNTRKS
jgi:hypothetical protein